MQLYHGTYLNVFEFTIPIEIFNNGTLLKHPKLNIYVIENSQEEMISEAIQVFITPYEYKDLSNIYWIEFTMPDEKGKTLNFLEKYTNEFNILDCKGVDSAEDTAIEKKGKVELIAKHEGTGSYNEKFEDDVIIKQSFKNQSIIDSNRYRLIASSSFSKKSLNKIRKEGCKINISKLPYTKWKDIKNAIEPYKNCYLSITSFSEGNFITIKFKNRNERIAPLRFEFEDNKAGTFRKIIESLSNIGVNLKLIRPIKLLGKLKEERAPHEPSIIYDIYFDIANTKLSIYQPNSIEKIIESHINEIEGISSTFRSAKIITEENFETSRDYLILPDGLSNSEIISKSNKQFQEAILNDLSNCSSCDGIFKSGCFLKTIPSDNFKALLDKIDNSITGDNRSIFAHLEAEISELKAIEISKLKFNYNENCEIKDQLIDFYFKIKNHINGSDTNDHLQATEDAPVEDPPSPTNLTKDGYL